MCAFGRNGYFLGAVKPVGFFSRLSGCAAARSVISLRSAGRLLAGWLIAALTPPFAMPAAAVSPDIVISQVYGGCGMHDGIVLHLHQDYVELFEIAAARRSTSMAGRCSTPPRRVRRGRSRRSPAPRSRACIIGWPRQRQWRRYGIPPISMATSMQASVGRLQWLTGTTALRRRLSGIAGVVDFVGYGSGTNCSRVSRYAQPGRNDGRLPADRGCARYRQQPGRLHHCHAWFPAIPHRHWHPAAGVAHVRVNDVSAAEGNTGAPPRSPFTVSPSAKPVLAESPDITTADGTASSASDAARCR